MWAFTWDYLALAVTYNGTFHTISTGRVDECLLFGSVIYRFRSDAMANMVRVEDSFYESFDDPALTGLLARKGY